MAGGSPAPAMPSANERPEGMDDAVLPFHVETLDARGRTVRLGAAIDKVIKRHAYPAPVSRALGEAAALTILLGSSLKSEGRFQLQAKTDGAVSMLVVDFEAPNRFRAYARFDAAQIVALGRPTTAALLGHGVLALTIDQGNERNRYQGIVALEGEGLEAAAHKYFRQSEQIPTRIRLAVGEVSDDSHGHSWRAGGLLVQFLPTSIERMRQADLDPGDRPDGASIDVIEEDEAWTETRLLVETVEDHELLDPLVTSERLLYRLFHQRGVLVYEPAALTEACRCSQQRIDAMLQRFSSNERRDMMAEDGRITVTCEFCSTVYHATGDAPAAAD
jgi:molecular chaperone Hsp33